MAEDDNLVLGKIQNVNRKRECSMAMIIDSPGDSADHDLSVFPPLNHENLSYDETHIRESTSPSSSSSSTWLSSSRSVSSVSLSPSDNDEISPPDIGPKPASMQLDSSAGESLHASSDFDGESTWKVRDCLSQVRSEVNEPWGLLVKILKKKVVAVVPCIQRFNAAITRAGRAAWPVISVMAMALWWWMCARAHRMNRGDGVDKLREVIKKKDQKIIQLLHQIAQMNELLVSYHKNLKTGQ